VGVSPRSVVRGSFRREPSSHVVVVPVRVLNAFNGSH
uniref:Uncharacterized protein n=1 Tax=Amphimedon queenslandica TaxID=400682 RepID=A0A1X7VJS3_AMPQE